MNKFWWENAMAYIRKDGDMEFFNEICFIDETSLLFMGEGPD